MNNSRSRPRCARRTRDGVWYDTLKASRFFVPAVHIFVVSHYDIQRTIYSGVFCHRIFYPVFISLAVVFDFGNGCPFVGCVRFSGDGRAPYAPL